MSNDTAKITYDPESDVLSWEISAKPISYAKEIGNVVIHMSAVHAPVLVEVLEATKLLTNAIGILQKSGIPFPKAATALPSVTQADFSG